MSGESAPRATVGSESLERAFGGTAACNACGARVAEYRVVALFLHETAAIRAYCARCYPAAADGDYHAGGDGLRLDYAAFAARFGAPGPPPPPTTPVDRMLAALVADPALRLLAPGSEAVARRRRRVPYPVRVGFALDGATSEARMSVAPDGRMTDLAGDPAACDRVRALLAGI
ncbi:MAG: hypothetical protein E6K81_11575 [Candidatus Eisenbacteria bacterium]|uniref:Uncharacterized protein n=1 Tax=Eiseniibacteriota bacterium TaxID=2212470 RepID=A0A538U4P1_UNCEI|nr:MAG: hypothetical protein E6K81_11575 [Candidatus Eisenbacteria bacterium]